MALSPITAPPELIRPDYCIYDYRNGIFKVVRHKGNKWYCVPFAERVQKGNTEKLDPALSRARRVVLELALCNDWKYFCTFTLSKDKHDRTDLDSWHKKFTQWLRDQRKKYPGLDCRFLLVPEEHNETKGTWHMHGFFGDISSALVSFKDLWDSGENIPWSLAENGYLNWRDYESKFGFCSFGLIRNKVAAGFYVTKYLSKSLNESAIKVGGHLYYASRPLFRAEKHGDGVYGNCGYLDSFLTNHYEFCDTGMTHVKDGLGWDFAMEYMTIEPLDIQMEDDPETVLSVDTFAEVTQEIILGF